ncbi:unnamed protein product [Cyprideis torosa]|uniref:Uncharacterized protein n=1 Tax=Cyprideis torosa TaxID=163714 RepID=A0A7R8W9X0_9CRUS|nr:unnamed protein product [Cyprideis torosa]CAG0890246.1 unnamed protein product [Cyprideis torosa]
MAVARGGGGQGGQMPPPKLLGGGQIGDLPPPPPKIERGNGHAGGPDGCLVSGGVGVGAKTMMDGRLKGAQKGHSLLKKKADALQLRFRMILGNIIETKVLMGDVMKEAAFSLAETKFACGDVNQVVLQNVTKAQIKVRSRKDNVAGVNLPVFEHYQDGSDTFELAGLARGGQQVARLKKNYAKAIKNDG